VPGGHAYRPSTPAPAELEKAGATPPRMLAPATAGRLWRQRRSTAEAEKAVAGGYARSVAAPRSQQALPRHAPAAGPGAVLSERLEAPEQERPAEALARQPQSGRAWALKERLRRLYRSASGAEAKVRLDAWLAAAWDSGLPSSQRLAATLTNWRRELLNYRRFPITNALVEGKHNRLKVMKRRAYGYRNRDNFLLGSLNLTPHRFT